MFKALCALLLVGVLNGPAHAIDSNETKKIDYLIASIADLHDAHFVRNGAEFDSRRAADHLRLKLRGAAGRVTSADEFIVDCATASSVTGEKYLIKFADGRVVEAAVFLRERLADYSTTSQSAGQHDY